MRTSVVYGVVLGVLVCLWMFVMGYTGWYKDPALLNLFFLVIPLQILVLIVALRKTAAEGRGYGGQVVVGLVLSLVAGIIVIGGSLLFTTVLFPDYFNELAAIQERMLREAQTDPARIEQQMAAYRRNATPMANAMQGFLGTVITGLVCSLVIAIFVRSRREPTPTAA